MEREQSVYLSALQDSLRSKYGLLEKIYSWTKEQERVLAVQELDMEVFARILDDKEGLIQQLLELDQGFERIYAKVKNELGINKQVYKPHIQEMQNLIRQNTDLGIKIQTLEQKNKQKFENIIAKQKQEIQEFRLNSRTTGRYIQHMANQHQEGQSYFLDKKK